MFNGICFNPGSNEVSRKPVARLFTPMVGLCESNRFGNILHHRCITCGNVQEINMMFSASLCRKCQAARVYYFESLKKWSFH